MAEQDVLIHLNFQEIDQFLAKLSYEQLRELNRRIIERIEILQKAGELVAMSKFNRGDRVTFHNGRKQISGTIIRLNQKTITIVTTKDGERRVPPSVVTLLDKM